jgi:isoaspartyl peptidase/L-asparaginase-like protein (Ntn-hydrolase superfamily)
MELIKGGGDTLDAVIAGVNIVELDPRDTSVGYGGLPNEDGVVELDASCIHGPTRRGGAVGALRGVKTPSKIAQLVLAETEHMMLVGEGAQRFAKVFGYQEEDLLTERSRLAWRMWKREMRDKNGPHQLGVDHRRSSQEENCRVEESVPRCGRRYTRLGVPGGGQSSSRHHQLHRLERKGRNVGGHHYQRNGVEDSRPVR